MKIKKKEKDKQNKNVSFAEEKIYIKVDQDMPLII